MRGAATAQQGVWKHLRGIVGKFDSSKFVCTIGSIQVIDLGGRFMIRRLEGSGDLLVNGTRLLSGKIELSHDLNCSNGLRVSLRTAGSDVSQFEVALQSAQGAQIERQSSLLGHVRRGLRFRIDKLMLADRSVTRTAGQQPGMTLDLLPRTSLLIGKDPGRIRTARFLIPNAVFGGMARTKRADGGSKLDSVLIKTVKNNQPIQMKLQQLPVYEDAIVSLRRFTGSEWTARLDITCANGLDLEEMKSLADDFMLLLSFALSRRLMWVALKVMDPGVTYREVRYGTAVNLKAFPSSVMGDGNMTIGAGRAAQHPLTNFLELALPAFWSLSKAEQKSLQQVLGLMCESIERFFSPAAITLVGRAFEILCHRFLGKEQQYYLEGSNQQHKELKHDLRERLEEFKESWETVGKDEANEWGSQLDGAVKGLLTRPLVLQIGILLDQLLTTSNPYDSAWPADFVRARNRAAHSSSIRDCDGEAWIKGLTLLSQMILKILGYTGSYVDFYGDGTSESKWSELN